MQNSNFNILVPVKLGFKPAKCVQVGDELKISPVGNLINKLAISTPSCFFAADYDSNRLNGLRLMQILSKKSVIGKVFAVFQNHFIVEISIEYSWFQDVDYRNSQTVEIQ